MSFEAINWAFSQPVSKSSAKFVLVAMANLAGDDMTCWPSYKHLTDATGQDIKTVEAGIRRLREEGFIVATGDRKGATGQVIVYRLNTTKTGVVSIQEHPSFSKSNTPVFPVNTPELGVVSEEAKTPVFPGNTPVFPSKDPQISHVTPPKTGGGTTNEPPMNRKEPPKKKARAASSFVLPDWLNEVHWKAWHSCSKRRNATEEQMQLAVEKLAGWREKGEDFAGALENAAVGGWQGLFLPTKNGVTQAPRNSGRHSGFGAIDYTTGIDADGTFA